MLLALAVNPAGTAYKLNVVGDPDLLQKYIVVVAVPPVLPTKILPTVEFNGVFCIIVLSL